MTHQASQPRHSTRCLLATRCALAASSDCNPQCPAWLATHGATGSGGRVGAANVPKDYALVTLNNAHCRDDQAQVYAVLADYARSFARNGRIKSVYLYSESPGTGKTTTAAALLHEFLTAHLTSCWRSGKQPAQRPAYFLDVNHFQTVYNRMHLAVGDDAKAPHSAEFDRLMNATMHAPFAVLDDIGVRSATEAFRAYLHDVINARLTAQLPTVYTSNVPMGQLRYIFDARLADRVRDMCVELPFSGESKRGRR